MCVYILLVDRPLRYISESDTATTVSGNAPGHAIQQPNPWEAPQSGEVSMADFWLRSTASSLAAAKDPSLAASGHPAINGGTPPPQSNAYNAPSFVPATAATAFPVQAQVHPTQRAPHISHMRSQSVDTSNVYAPSQQNVTLHELAQQRHVIPQFQPKQNGSVGASNSAGGHTVVAAPATSDPFEAAWQSKAAAGPKSTNPFQAGNTITKAFEVKL